MLCIQSAYACKVRTSASGSAWAEKVALGLQYALHPSQPLPVSQASKNCMATCLIDAMGPPGTLCFWFKLSTRSHTTSHEQQAASLAPRSFAARGGVATPPKQSRPRGADRPDHPVASPIHPGKDDAAGGLEIEHPVVPPSRFIIDPCAAKRCEQQVKSTGARPAAIGGATSKAVVGAKADNVVVVGGIPRSSPTCGHAFTVRRGATSSGAVVSQALLCSTAASSSSSTGHSSL